MKTHPIMLSKNTLTVEKLNQRTVYLIMLGTGITGILLLISSLYSFLPITETIKAWKYPNYPNFVWFNKSSNVPLISISKSNDGCPIETTSCLNQRFNASIGDTLIVQLNLINNSNFSAKGATVHLAILKINDTSFVFEGGIVAKTAPKIIRRAFLRIPFRQHIWSIYGSSRLRKNGVITSFPNEEDLFDNGLHIGDIKPHESEVLTIRWAVTEKVRPL